MKNLMLTLKRILVVSVPLLVVSFMSSAEWVSRSQMIENETQKNIVFNVVSYIDEKTNKNKEEDLVVENIVEPVIYSEKMNIGAMVLATTYNVEKDNLDIENEQNLINQKPEIKNEVVNTFTENINNKNVNKILLVGDSLMSEIAFGLKDQISKGIKLKDIHKSSTGLTNKDYYDWNINAYDAALNYSPDIVFIHMGGNDGQDMRVNGKFVKLYSAEWENEYFERVKGLISKIKSASPNAEIIWIGLPGMRDQKYEKKTAIIRSAQKRGALESGIEFLDAGDAIGHSYIKQERVNGKMLDLRRTDGIHYSRSGGTLIAKLIIDKKNIKINEK